MMVINEPLLRQAVGNKFKSFQGIVDIESLGTKMLVTVTEYEIEIDLRDRHRKVNQFSMLHGNKHILRGAIQ